ERNALRESVYPQLYLYCKQRGYDFKLVDLRWGVEDAVSDCHNTVSLHLDLLRDCQDLEGPNFFLFTGQKHDTLMLPVTVPKSVFEAIVSAIERKRMEVSKRKVTEAKSGVISESSVSLKDTNAAGSHTHELQSSKEKPVILINNSPVPDSSTEGEVFSIVHIEAKSGSDFKKEISLLHLWYKFDENHVPAVYCLLPVSTHYKDILSKDPLRRQQAKKNWLHTSQKICSIFQYYGSIAMGEKTASSLLRTVLDFEVEQGLRTVDPPENHCTWYKRTITDIKYNLRSEKASDYIDILASDPEINQKLYSAHQKFMENIHTKLRHTNIFEYSVGWGRDGINPKLNRSHLHYTERICSDFHRTVTGHLNRITRSNTVKGSLDVRRRETSRARIKEEILQHIHHRQVLEMRCELQGCFVDGLREALESSCQKPVVLIGRPGSGKSTVMARAAYLAQSWIPGNVRVLVRFVGVTGESRNVRLLLQSLCFQLSDMCDVQAKFSESLHELANEFLSLLESGREDSPVVILLDGLDELSEDHASDISWLSPVLPKHVHLIVSASTGSSCLKTLEELTVKPITVLMNPLSPDDINRMLRRVMERDGRRLAPDQWKILTEACMSCPCPLYLENAYAESRLWTSFTSPAHLPQDLSKLYQSTLLRLEKEHGQQLVRKTASLITLSRNGITEEELLDLLSLDQRVMQEMALSHKPPAPQFPFVLWARLRRDLGDHLMEQNTDNTYVFNWTHLALKSACEERYLKAKEAQVSIHAEYADYFLGNRSPHSNSKAHKFIFQPLTWVLEKDSIKNYVFNIQKLRSVSYHLIKAGQIPALLTECLFNYEFLLHKAWGLSIVDVEEDLKSAVTPEKELVDVNVLTEALRLSKNVLLRDPCQLASQLVGRLYEIVSSDQPVAPGDPRKFSHLHSLLSQCCCSSLPVLLPSFTCLLPPGGLLHHLLAGHTDSITAVAGAKKDLVAASASRDGTLKLWDVSSGRAIRTLGGVGRNIDSITLCLDNKMVALTEKHSLRVWDIASEIVVYSENESLDVPVLTSTLDGNLLVVFYDGSHCIKVFDVAASCRLLHRVTITPDTTPIHKDHSILVSHNSLKDYVLFAYRSGAEAMVFSARKGEVVKQLPAQHGVASVQGVEVTKEYFLIFCRYPFMRSSEIVHIELFSTRSFEFLRSIKGCCNDPVSNLSVNRLGSHVVAFCPSADTNTTDIISWNLETEDHKHIVKSPGLITGGTCFDLRFCLGVCNNENYLRVWNLASKINDQSLCYNVHRVKGDGIEEIFPMENYPRYVVCKSTKPGTVSVWNIMKSSCKGKPVRLERGLYENTDIALPKNMKLYILTDRGTADFTDTPRPIFQTLLIFDLLKKRYIKKQTGLYIIPCQKHEYRILQGDLLLGLSENRDHLIMWSLETGFIKGRLKASYKEQPLMSNSVQIPKSSTDKGFQELQYKAERRHDSRAHMTPWERRNETKTAQKRRLEREVKKEIEKQQQFCNEKHNTIDQYLISPDEQIAVCSYFAHHLNVFSLLSQTHLHTLEDRTSMLFLHNAALTYSGSYLAISNYSDTEKVSYVTLWDVQNGKVRKRLKNEPSVCCVAINNDASRVVFGVMEANKLKVWDPFRRVHKTISGYESLNLGVNSKLYITEEGAKAILLTGMC
ncbi:NWD2 protein, partial [Amia calva]|nr:NWD2 protein [Amia calva]